MMGWKSSIHCGWPS